MSKELQAKRQTRPTKAENSFGLEILHISKGEQPQTHQVLMALWWAIFWHRHKHACPLALGASPPMSVQLSDNLDPCRLHREASRQQAGLICGQASLRSPDDLYRTFPQCFALSRQFRRAQWWMAWGGVEAEQARYWSRNSPETKKLFFTATESTCMCGCFTWIAQQALVSSV